MDDFSTYQGALNVFKRVNFVGNQENCIFGAIVDHSKSSEFTASMIGNGLLGTVGLIAGQELMRAREERLSKFSDFFYVLLNITEKGVGIMPLYGMPYKIDPEKMEPRYDGFIFFNKEEVLGIGSKNYYGIRKSVKTITITLVNNKKMYFTANIKENKLPYQEPSMKNIVERYQK